MHMRDRQYGLSLTALLIGAFVLVVVALLGMKLVPAFIEYQTAKKAIYAIATEGSPTVADVRKSFYNRSVIDDITAVKADELEITKEGGEIVISFAYRKEVPLGGGIGIYIDFAANTKMRER
jgi:hypothetical protein